MPDHTYPQEAQEFWRSVLPRPRNDASWRQRKLRGPLRGAGLQALKAEFIDRETYREPRS